MEITTEVMPIVKMVPAQPTPEPAAPGAAKEELTREQLDDASNKMMQVMGFEPMTEETRKLEAEKGKPKPEATTAPAPVAPPAPVVAAPAAVPAPPTRKRFDARAIADEAAEKAAKKVLDDQQARNPQPPAPVVAPFEMTPEDKHDNEVLAFMEKKGTVEKGMTARHREFVRTLADYKAKWLRDHPGEDFDPSANEHNDFYSKNEPQFDQDKFTAAEKDWDFEKRYQARAKETDSQAAEEIKTMKFERRVEKLNPQIEQAQSNAIAHLIKDVDPDAFKLVSTAEGALDLSQGTLVKLQQYNPPLARYIVAAAKQIDSAIGEIRKFSDPELSKLGYRFTPNENPVHSYIGSVGLDAEKLLMEAPPETRVRDGKDFVTSRQWNQKLNEAGNDVEKRDAVLKGFWTFSSDDLEQLVVAAEMGSVKGKIAEFEEFNEHRNKSRGVVTKEQPAAAQPPTPTDTPQTRGRVAPPSLASSADTVTTQPGGAPAAESFGKTAISVAF